MIVLILSLLLILFLLTSVFVVSYILFALLFSDAKGSPFITNDSKVIKKSLDLLELTEDDTFCDLGSGDGSIVISAVKEYGVKRAIGYEISPLPYFISKYKVKRQKDELKPKISIYKEDISKAELKDVSAIYVYLLPDLLESLSPRFLKLKQENPNLRIVSAVFEIKNLKLEKSISEYHRRFKKNIEIYLY